MIISVFGSASPTPESQLYQEALLLGKLVAKNGHTVMTGGYCGTMEAVSKGAVEAGGHSIGVTCRQIEEYRPLGPNSWVREVIHTDTLTERIEVLTSQADAFMALPGGIGTLAEISMVFNKMVIAAIPSDTLILIGDGWKQTFEAFLKGQSANINSKTQQIPQFAANPQEALALLNNKHQENNNG
ncbi:MAG TPA: LOG family protein [Chloroflexi bacterium]|nr:LOG family protein [Chloroflexota bacterium]